jgi:hypothetical protein
MHANLAAGGLMLSVLRIAALNGQLRLPVRWERTNFA